MLEDERDEKYKCKTQKILAEWADHEIEIQNTAQTCIFCNNPENIISSETFCTGCSKLEDHA